MAWNERVSLDASLFKPAQVWYDTTLIVAHSVCGDAMHDWKLLERAACVPIDRGWLVLSPMMVGLLKTGASASTT